MTKRALIAMGMLAAALPATGQSKFDPTLVVVMGGGISAGFADFHLTPQRQIAAWPSLIAGPMGTIIPVPTFRESGQAGILNSFQPLPGLLPVVPQGGERALPFPLFALNISVPFLKVRDSLRLRANPRYDGSKLIVAIENDLLDTFVNAILGGPLLTLENPVLLTQAEYAQMLNPTAIFIELGYQDVLDAALARDASRLPSVSSFTSDYQQLLAGMIATNASVIVMTLPNPMDAAYFTTIDEAAKLQGLDATELKSRTGLSSGDLLTIGGLVEVSDILRGRRDPPLSPDSVLRAATAAAIQTAVDQFNAAIRDAAPKQGATLFDLNGYLHQVRTQGASIGGKQMLGTYGGGFYSTDGLFPSAAGQQLLGAAILRFVNSTFGANYSPEPGQ